MQAIKGITAIVAVALLGLFAFGIFHWTVNRVYVPPGKSLKLSYKGPLLFGERIEVEGQRFAEEGEVGVQGQLMGPGRHFYCPIWWVRTVIDDVVIKPGQVGIVKSKIGDGLPAGEFLVDGDLGSTDHKGVLRKVLAPGRYRVHDWAYEVTTVDVVKSVGQQVKHSGWVNIPTGYVGVVTYMADDPVEGKQKGIQSQVLPPGIYPVNGQGMQVDIVEIGYREASLHVDKQEARDGTTYFDESGEPVPEAETGINFPSNDGFEIQMDFTAIWGVMPENAPDIVRKFGNIGAVERKVIIPQSESICRNNGSKLGAVELLVGESRLKFQHDVSNEFQEVLAEKGISLLYGLVRHIYIPREVRLPIQQSFVADELKLTRDQEQITAGTEAQLREEEKKVDLEAEKIRMGTLKMVASVTADGEKKAQEIGAETKQLVAAIDKQAAELDAQRIVVLGRANADAHKMSEEAKADRFRLAVEAFGSGSAYTNWQFAEGLPETIDLKLLYAGEGTLWTDLKNITPTVPLRQPKK